MYHHLKTFKFLPKVSQQKFPLSCLSAFRPVPPSFVVYPLKTCCFPRAAGLLCRAPHLLPVTKSKPETRRELYYFLNSKRALYILTNQRHNLPLQLQYSHGSKVSFLEPSFITSVLQWHTLFLTTSSPCLPLPK